MSNKFLTEIKRVMPDLVDNNGNFRTIPTGKTGERKLSKDRIEILEMFVRLLKDTNIICRETREYIFNRYITIAGVTEALNNEGGRPNGKAYVQNTVSSKIDHDRNTLTALVGESFLVDVIAKHGNKAKLDEYREAISLAYIKKGDKGNSKKDIRDEVALPLNRKVYNTKLSEAEFNQFISDIAPYLKNQIKAVAESLDNNCVGYFNYLTLSPMLSDVDKERLDRLKLMMGLIDNQVVASIGSDDSE